jgi:DNA-directed RNA polymerase specialized sigma24 family protein
MNASISCFDRHILGCRLPVGDEALTALIGVWLDEQERAGQADRLNRQVLQNLSVSPSGDTNMSAHFAERMPTLTRLILMLRIPHAMQIKDIARTFKIRPRRVRRHLRRAVAIVARNRR